MTGPEKIYLSGKDRLPRLRSRDRRLMKLYGAFGAGWLRRWIIRSLQLPVGTSITPGFFCVSGQLICDGAVALGDTLFVDYAPVYIGKNVGFSFRNTVITSTHDLCDFRKVITKPVVIEDNVWITANVTILSGVRIGKNSVIGAGSVVTKDIPPDVFAAGNPCIPIREIRRDSERPVTT